MTYLEVLTADKNHRWPINGLPTGKMEADYLKRTELINKALRHFDDNMSYAFPNAKISIVHESNFKPWHPQLPGARKKGTSSLRTTKK